MSSTRLSPSARGLKALTATSASGQRPRSCEATNTCLKPFRSPSQKPYGQSFASPRRLAHSCVPSAQLTEIGPKKGLAFPLPNCNARLTTHVRGVRSWSQPTPTASRSPPACWPAAPHLSCQRRALTDWWAEYVALLAKSKRKKPMHKEFPPKLLAILTSRENSLISRRADLAAWWKWIPPEMPYPRNPQIPARMALLRTYINKSQTEPWAQDGLRGLLSELRANGDIVPDILVECALDQWPKEPTKPRRGRPEETDQNLRVCIFFLLLRRYEFPRQAAINFIADNLGFEPDGVRSIVRRGTKEGLIPRNQIG